MNVRRVLFLAVGCLCLVFGAFAIVVPVLPTTPFVLLAATCFAKSSPRFYLTLQRNRIFGPFIDNYRNGKGVPRSIKIFTLTFLWVGLIISAMLVHRPLVYAILAACGLAVTWHVLSLRPRAAVLRAESYSNSGTELPVENVVSPS
jgi:uncharacterized membrane protein YbaN (DUF454 family)